jgi:hypothetical protein
VLSTRRVKGEAHVYARRYHVSLAISLAGMKMWCVKCR